MSDPQTTSPNPPTTPAPAASPPPQAQAQGPDYGANIAKMPLAEKVLGVLALLVIVGWLLLGKPFWYMLFKDWFATLSFLGAVAVATILTMKTFGVRPIPPAIERQVIPIASLLPVLGFLITYLLSGFAGFLTVGGSLALAYVSATTYWKKRIPEFATNPLGKDAGGSA